MVGNVPFLMKDVVLLAVSVYLLRQDLLRVLRGSGRSIATTEGWREGSLSTGGPLP